jgi:uncharacterized membrane protein
MGMGGGWLGLLVSLGLFLGTLLPLGLAAIWLARQLQRGTTPSAAPEALEIARQRLAAGEITVPEFEEIRDRLRG